MRPAPLAPLFLLLVLPALAQTQSTPSLSVTTRLVTVDVVVRDHGQPVRGLTQRDFAVFEDGHSQSIAFFEPHSDAASLSVIVFETRITPLASPSVHSGKVSLDRYAVDFAIDPRAGDVYLRLGVYDPASGHMGTLEIPLAAALKTTTPGN